MGVETDQGRIDGRHGRHRHRRVDAASCSPSSGIDVPRRHRAAPGAGHRAPPARHPTRSSTGRWRPSSTRCSATSPSWDQRRRSWRPYEIETGQLDAAARVAAGQRRDAARLPDGLPGRGDATTVTLDGPARHGAGDHRTTSPGLRDVGHRPHVGRRAARSRRTSCPIVDEVRPGLFVAAGHIFGNAAGPMTGKLVSQMLAGQRAGDRHVGLPLGPRASSRSRPAPPCTGERPPGLDRRPRARCATRCGGSSIERSSRPSPSGSGPTTTRPTCCRRSPSSACSACRSRRSTAAASSTSSATRSCSRSWPGAGWGWPASSAARGSGCWLIGPLRHRGAAATATSPTSPPAGG